MHRILAAFFCLLFGVFETPSSLAGTDMIAVPIVSTFHHWDHHWYIWLPGDPIHEAVEVMTRERGGGASPLVWVFFTDRETPKPQTHYLSDARVATALGAQFRRIDFIMTGTEGQPRGITLEFSDKDGSPVAVDVQFVPGAQLVTKGAGLTDQIGHSANRHFLIFFREKNAIAETRSVTLDGVNVAQPRPGQNHPTPWPAAYSSNIFVGLFPFLARQVAFCTAKTADRNVVRFGHISAQGVFAATLTDGTQLELDVNGDQGVQLYRHREGSHSLEISFDPPLPMPDHHLSAAASSTFRIHLDQFRDLIAGTVNVSRRDNSSFFNWMFEKPKWTIQQRLQTIVSYESGGEQRIEVRPATGQ